MFAAATLNRVRRQRPWSSHKPDQRRLPFRLRSQCLDTNNRVMLEDTATQECVDKYKLLRFAYRLPDSCSFTPNAKSTLVHDLKFVVKESHANRL